MKRLIAIFLVVILSSCESLEECVKHTGNTAAREVAVSSFDKIIVRKGIALVITQADTYSVNIVSGENLIDDIRAEVKDRVLTLTDDTTCNWVRDYGQTTVYVTAPNLTHIISKTELDITSGNVLTYPSLLLESLDLSDGAGTGDFHLQVANESMEISSNNVSGFYLSGTTNSLVAGFYEGNGVLKAQELIANTIYVFHRGSNNMFVHPVESISGELFSTGNVFCSPQPPVVSVIRHYQGRLIFE
jgi:hypothetical protein